MRILIGNDFTSLNLSIGLAQAHSELFNTLSNKDAAHDEQVKARAHLSVLLSDRVLVTSYQKMRHPYLFYGFKNGSSLLDAWPPYLAAAAEEASLQEEGERAPRRCVLRSAESFIINSEYVNPDTPRDDAPVRST